MKNFDSPNINHKEGYYGWCTHVEEHFDSQFEGPRYPAASSAWDIMDVSGHKNEHWKIVYNDFIYEVKYKFDKNNIYEIIQSY